VGTEGCALLTGLSNQLVRFEQTAVDLLNLDDDQSDVVML
jgi:hypothetical protein